MAGRVLGTTDYVSPEQALGQPVTGQSDLYSLGVVLYEMLTGDVPFRGESPVAVAMRHVREQVPDVQRAAPGGLRRDRRGASNARSPRTSPSATGRRQHGRRPRGGARDRGLPLRPGHRRGDERAAHAAPELRGGGCPGACATRALGGVAGAARRDRGDRARARRRATPTAAWRPDVPAKPRPAAGPPRPDRRPRLQPVRHRPRKPRPGLQRRRRRSQHDVEHRALLDGTLAASRGVGVYLDAARACWRGRSRSRRPRRASPCRSTRRTASAKDCPTATRRR